MEDNEKEKGKYFTSKRIIIILLTLAAVFAALAVVIHFTTRVSNESYADCELGDVNGDGIVNSGDALAIIKSITGVEDLFENQEKNGDVNNDGNLDAADALIVLRYCIDDVKALPYTEFDSQQGSETANKVMTLQQDSLTVSANILNEWKNTDGTTSYQISLTVENSDEDASEDWTVKLTMSDSVTISKKWDCSASADKNIIEISGEAGYESSDCTCGLIVSAKDELSIQAIETE